MPRPMVSKPQIGLAWISTLPTLWKVYWYAHESPFMFKAERAKSWPHLINRLDGLLVESV